MYYHNQEKAHQDALQVAWVANRIIALKDQNKAVDKKLQPGTFESIMSLANDKFHSCWMTTICSRRKL
jgi:hypothetical protein